MDSWSNSLASIRHRLFTLAATSALLDLACASPAEDPGERFDDAIRVPLAHENRALAIQVIHIVDIVPLFRGWVRRGALKVVQDQHGLGPHTRINWHFLPLLVR